jgi:hypothetical protein
LYTNRFIEQVPALFYVIHPRIRYFNDQTVGATASKKVSVHLCGGPKRDASRVELQFAPRKVFLKRPGDHHTDTCVIVRMRRKPKARFISSLEKGKSRNALNPSDPAMVARIGTLSPHGCTILKSFYKLNS